MLFSYVNLNYTLKKVVVISQVDMSGNPKVIVGRYKQQWSEDIRNRKRFKEAGAIGQAMTKS